MASIEESSRGGRILLYQGLRYRKNLKRMIPYIGIVVLVNVILQFEQTFLEIPMLLEFMESGNIIIRAIVQTLIKIMDILTMILIMRKSICVKIVTKR